MSNLTFSDVPSSHWASRFIYSLAASDIVSGYPDGKFGPEDPVTIGEFCTLVVRAANITSVINDGTSYDHWARKYTNYVENKGILLRPETETPIAIEYIDEPIQRQFAFNIIWRIVASKKYSPQGISNIPFEEKVQIHNDYREDTLPPPPYEYDLSFKDEDQIDNCNKGSISLLYSNQILKGYYNGMLKPQININRAETSSILDRLLVNDEYIVTSDDGLNVRDEASISGTILHTFKKSEVIKVLPEQKIHGEKRGWVKVYYDDNETGWVAEEYVVPFVKPRPGEIDENDIKSMLDNIETNAKLLGLDREKPKHRKTIKTIIEIGRTMLKEGYKATFVAGMLANIKHEGNAGQFENSAYDSNPDEKPDYLIYMDANYYYGDEYSAKYIYDEDRSLSNIYNMLLELEPNGWYDNDKKSRRGFGLGSVQWTFGRTKTLVDYYRNEADPEDTITFDQVLTAEGKMISHEFKESKRFKHIYSKWFSQNHKNYDPCAPAYYAGILICEDYESPNDSSEKKAERGSYAMKLCAIMMGL